MELLPHFFFFVFSFFKNGGILQQFVGGVKGVTSSVQPREGCKVT